ncbi:MAG: glycosyltransferase family 4 protein [Solirubrobacteraceae bacterium]|nr:glycosyltransferase family 4 protein [Solirubrobacteraceae bacterium]
MRALIVSNMWPTAERPALGTFVRDQVEALRRRGDVELELATFPPGGINYLRAVPALRRLGRFDVVHAHFGLTALPALASRGEIHGVTLHGTDLISPRSRRVTTALLPRYDVVGVPSEHAIGLLPHAQRVRAQVLPCGIDMAQFTPLTRAEARTALGLDPSSPFALFPYDPTRPNKRHDLAAAASRGHHLVALGHEPRERMHLWLNAASVVLCPSTWETFGMAAAEAAACGTPVIATPTGAHREVLDPLPWCTCEAFDLEVWRRAVDEAIAADAQHDGGREHVGRWSSDAMAARLVDAWRGATEAHRQSQG